MYNGYAFEAASIWYILATTLLKIEGIIVENEKIFSFVTLFHLPQ